MVTLTKTPPHLALSLLLTVKLMGLVSLVPLILSVVISMVLLLLIRRLANLSATPKLEFV